MNDKAIAQTHCFPGQSRQIANYKTVAMLEAKKKRLDIQRLDIYS